MALLGYDSEHGVFVLAEALVGPVGVTFGQIESQAAQRVYVGVGPLVELVMAFKDHVLERDLRRQLGVEPVWERVEPELVVSLTLPRGVGQRLGDQFDLTCARVDLNGARLQVAVGET